MTNQEVKTIIKRAEQTNVERDAIERANGFAPPSNCPTDETIRTVIVALEAGIKTEDWDCIAEGLVMLADLHTKFDSRGRKYEPWKRHP